MKRVVQSRHFNLLLPFVAEAGEQMNLYRREDGECAALLRRPQGPRVYTFTLPITFFLSFIMLDFFFHSIDYFMAILDRNVCWKVCTNSITT